MENNCQKKTNETCALGARQAEPCTVTTIDESLQNTKPCGYEEKCVTRKSLEEKSNTLALFLAHDLREPLRTINSFLDIISSDSQNQFTQESELFISMMKKNVQRLNAFVNNIIQTHMNDHKNIDSRVNISAVLEDVKEMLWEAMHEGGGTEIVVTTKLPDVLANHTKLTHVFINLIHNAIKNMGEEKHIIELSAERNNNLITFFLKNNGKKLSLTQEQELSVKNSEDGLGIGCTLCHVFLGRQAHTLSLKNNADSPGCTASFSVPAYCAER